MWSAHSFGHILTLGVYDTWVYGTMYNEQCPNYFPVTGWFCNVPQLLHNWTETKTCVLENKEH